MKINPISFGKTIRVENSNLAFKIKNILNNDQYEPKNDVFVRQVKKVFNDISDNSSWNENALVWDNTDDKSYVLTGEEARKTREYINNYYDANDEAGAYYGAGDLFELSIENNLERLNERISKLIDETKEHFILSVDTTDVQKMRLKKIKDKTASSVQKTDLQKDNATFAHRNEGIFSSIYNDLIENGINESDAYMKALAEEKELLGSYPHNN